jgi:hypothetical protein
MKSWLVKNFFGGTIVAAMLLGGGLANAGWLYSLIGSTPTLTTPITGVLELDTLSSANLGNVLDFTVSFADPADPVPPLETFTFGQGDLLNLATVSDGAGNLSSLTFSTINVFGTEGTNSNFSSFGPSQLATIGGTSELVTWNYGLINPPTLVPEPAVLLPSMLAAFGLIGLRRRSGRKSHSEGGSDQSGA